MSSEITCEAAWTWTHGMVVSNVTTEVGSTINVTCATEYQLSTGDEYIISTCDENGLWDPPLKDCVCKWEDLSSYYTPAMYKYHILMQIF